MDMETGQAREYRGTGHVLGEMASAAQFLTDAGGLMRGRRGPGLFRLPGVYSLLSSCCWLCLAVAGAGVQS